MATSRKSPASITAALCQRIEAIRLSRNITQAMLAEEAGLSRSTVARIADGNNVSLDSFIRVLQALGLSDHLEALLPDPEIRPVEQVKFRGAQRRRARAKRKKSGPWTWGDESNDR